MGILGTILGCLLIVGCLTYIGFSIFKIVRDLKEKRAAKKGKSDADESVQADSDVNNEEVDKK